MIRLLQRERQRLGMSQFQLSLKTGIPPSTISRLEGGKVFPYPGWREKIAKALDWPVERAMELFQEVSGDTQGNKLG